MNTLSCLQEMHIKYKVVLYKIRTMQISLRGGPHWLRNTILNNDVHPLDQLFSKKYPQQFHKVRMYQCYFGLVSFLPVLIFIQTPG